MPAPYPVLSTIVEAARIRLNDAIIPGGEVLTDTASFTVDYVNLAWQKFQQYLVGMGYVTLEDETTISGLAAVQTLDPGVQTSLSWTGYNNGGSLDSGRFLPESLIRPLDVWERPNVAAPAVNTNSYQDMDEILHGLPSVPKQFFQQLWEWRADAIYMPGATQATDLRIRFAKYLADFVADAIVAFALQPVPIMRCEDSFSGFIAYEMCGSRGDVDAQSILADAKESSMIIVGLDSMDGRATQKTSERSKMKDRYSSGAGAQ